jgi:hypothetical protein
MLIQQPKGQLYSKYEQKMETKQTHTHKQKKKQGNLFNTENNTSVSAITPAIMR